MLLLTTQEGLKLGSFDSKKEADALMAHLGFTKLVRDDKNCREVFVNTSAGDDIDSYEYAYMEYTGIHKELLLTPPTYI